MNRQRVVHLVLAAVAAALCSASQARQEYDGSVVVAEAVDGAMSDRVDDPDRVKAIVQEVNALRRRSWSAYEGKLKACAVRLTFLADGRRVGRLVLQGDELIELGIDRTSGYKRELGSLDAPSTRRLAAKIRRPSACAK